MIPGAAGDIEERARVGHRLADKLGDSLAFAGVVFEVVDRVVKFGALDEGSAAPLLSIADRAGPR